MLFPLLARYAQEHGYRIVLSEHQNHYPDVSFVALDDGRIKIALDVKSSYRVDDRTVSGFTLGAFTGYFRDRVSRKNTTFSYSEYGAHYVLGVIYSRNPKATDEGRVYPLEELTDIVSVGRDFQYFSRKRSGVSLPTSPEAATPRTSVPLPISTRLSAATGHSRRMERRFLMIIGRIT